MEEYLLFRKLLSQSLLAKIKCCETQIPSPLQTSGQSLNFKEGSRKTPVHSPLYNRLSFCSFYYSLITPFSTSTGSESMSLAEGL